MGGDRVNGGYIRKNQTSTCGRHPNNINGIKHTLGVSSSFARKDPKTKKDKSQLVGMKRTHMMSESGASQEESSVKDGDSSSLNDEPYIG